MFPVSLIGIGALVILVHRLFLFLLCERSVCPFVPAAIPNRVQQCWRRAYYLVAGNFHCSIFSQLHWLTKLL